MLGNTWMDKEDVVHIYNGILLSHKKGWNNAIYNNMDEPRDYHTKWSKWERERQISHDITYMCNLKKWYKWTYLQNRDRPRHGELTCSYQGVGKRGRDRLGAWDWQIHTTIYKMDGQ